MLRDSGMFLRRMQRYLPRLENTFRIYVSLNQQHERGDGARRGRPKGQQPRLQVNKNDGTSETEGCILGFRYIMQMQLHNDQRSTFSNEWEYAAGGIRKLLPNDILRSLF